MANPGFNIKVRRVENGYTIHVVKFLGVGSDNEEHLDFVSSGKDGVRKIVELNLEKLFTVVGGE